MKHEKKLHAWLDSWDDFFCDVCGLKAGLLIGSTHESEFQPTIRCGDHVHDIKQYYGDVLDGVDGGNQEVWLLNEPGDANMARRIAMQNNDARWFSANPQRSHRLRRGDISGGGDVSGWVTMVRQKAPGVRDYLCLETGDLKIPDDDDLLLVIFEEYMQIAERSGLQGEADLFAVIQKAQRIKQMGGFA